MSGYKDPEIPDFPEFIPEYNLLGGKINNYIQWVENNWNVNE